MDSDSNEIYVTNKTDNDHNSTTQPALLSEQQATNSIKDETIIKIPTIPKTTQEQPKPISTTTIPITNETASTPVITSSVKSALGMMQRTNEEAQPQLITNQNQQATSTAQIINTQKES